MGVVTFVNGLARLGAPIVGAKLIAWGSVATVMYIGGALVLLSALLSWTEARREARQAHLTTVTSFEAQFTARSTRRT